MSRDSRIPNLGKLSLALLEHGVEPFLGSKAIQILREPNDEKQLRISLERAIANCEMRFTKECDDQELAVAILGLPLANLPSIKDVLRDFYSKPNDPTLIEVFRRQLELDYPSISNSRIESATAAYSTILKEELVPISQEVRDKLSTYALLNTEKNTARMADAVESINSALQKSRQLLPVQGPESIFDFSVTPGIIHFIECLLAYLEDESKSLENANIEDFLDWAKRQEGIMFTNIDLARIIKLLETNTQSGNNILKALVRRVSHNKYEALTNLAVQLTSKRWLTDNNILMGDLSEKEQHRLRVSAHLLEVASRNLAGSGMRSDLATSFKVPYPGTLSFRWRIGEKSPQMMLVELVGGVLEDRISVILNPNNSFSLRAYDSLGHTISIDSTTYRSGTVVVSTVVWDERRISFWIGGHLIGERKIQSKFQSIWSLLLAGIDIDGKLSADTGQVGYKIDGMVGLNLGKNGSWKGARLNDIFILNKVASPKEIRQIAAWSKEEILALKKSAS